MGLDRLVHGAMHLKSHSNVTLAALPAGKSTHAGNRAHRGPANLHGARRSTYALVSARVVVAVGAA